MTVAVWWAEVQAGPLPFLQMELSLVSGHPWPGAFASEGLPFTFGFSRRSVFPW